MAINVKICGITDKAAINAITEYGASFAGFVFFKRSPRNIEPTKATELCANLPKVIGRVGLFVNPDNDFLDQILNSFRPDILQLHGTETPARVAQIKNRYGLPVMKAIPVQDANDLKLAEQYTHIADRFLFDAKPPKNATRPGGNAVSFNWNLMKSHMPDIGNTPWMLAGGIDCSNINQAVIESGALCVDVSSGVESAPGQKDPALIKNLLQKCKSINPLAV